MIPLDRFVWICHILSVALLKGLKSTHFILQIQSQLGDNEFNAAIQHQAMANIEGKLPIYQQTHEVKRRNFLVSTFKYSYGQKKFNFPLSKSKQIDTTTITSIMTNFPFQQRANLHIQNVSKDIVASFTNKIRLALGNSLLNSDQFIELFLSSKENALQEVCLFSNIKISISILMNIFIVF